MVLRDIGGVYNFLDIIFITGKYKGKADAITELIFGSVGLLLTFIHIGYNYKDFTKIYFKDLAERRFYPLDFYCALYRIFFFIVSAIHLIVGLFPNVEYFT
jgi:hypothetical protein